MVRLFISFYDNNTQEGVGVMLSKEGHSTGNMFIYMSMYVCIYIYTVIITFIYKMDPAV